MSTIEIVIDLPFYLRVDKALSVSYEAVCQEAQIPELVGRNLEITFSQRPTGPINKMSSPNVQYVRTTVGIKAETSSDLSRESVNTFAMRNSLELVNKLITSYQATTTDVSNAGFIFPLGTSDIQLFAEISVDGVDFRDRYPGHNINTIPLSPDKVKEFEHYLIRQEDLPLTRLFLTNAILCLGQGQYPLAVLQAATAVELRMTQYVVGKLKAASWSTKKIRDYEKKTPGQKLRFGQADPRSLEKHLGSVVNYPQLHMCLKRWFTPLRNKVIHRGHLASHEEAIESIKIARQFLKLVT